MAEHEYIELWDSEEDTGGKFAVLRDGRQYTIKKMASAEETFDGGIDVTMGGIHRLWVLVIRVREEEPEESDYGTLGTLKTLYELNNPNGTPSNVITYTDHEENEYEVYMLGDFQENLLGVRITGQYAIYTAQIQLREKTS